MKKINLLLIIMLGALYAGFAQVYSGNTHYIANNDYSLNINISDTKTDGSGNTYISGTFTAATLNNFTDIDFDPGPGTANISRIKSTVECTVLFLAKYNAAGQYQWVRWAEPYGETAGVSGGRLAIANNGNIYMTLNVKQSVELNTGEELTGPYVYGVPVQGFRGHVIEYTPAGDVDVFYTGGSAADGSAYLKIDDILADPILGHLYIAGVYRGTLGTLPTTTAENVYLRYLSTFNGAVLNTVLVSDETTRAFVTNLELASDGDLLITWFNTTGGSSNNYLAKYSTGFNVRWSTSVGSTFVNMTYASSGNIAVLYNEKYVNELAPTDGTVVNTIQLTSQDYTATCFDYASNGDIYSAGTIDAFTDFRALFKTSSSGDQSNRHSLSTISSTFSSLDYNNGTVTLRGNTEGFDADLSTGTTVIPDGVNVISYSEDVITPLVASSTPADNATGVSVDLEEVRINFDEKVYYNANHGATTLALREVGNATPVKSYDLTDPSVLTDVAGNVMLILGDYYISLKGLPTLSSNKQYYVQLNYSGVSPFGDWSMNPLAAFNTSTVNFTTESTNNTPTNITLSSSSINENNAVNAVVGNLSTTDADAGDSHTYSLVSGAGSTDNASFNISGNQLRASAAFDYEAKSSYSIRVQTNDGTATYQKQFTIMVNDVADTDVTPPTVVSFSPTDNATGVALDAELVLSFNENVTAGESYVRVRKKINNAQVLGGRPKFETEPFTFVNNTLTIHLMDANGPNSIQYGTEYYVELTSGSVEDLNGNDFAGFTDNNTWTFTTVAAPNNTPTNITLSSSSIDENNAINAVIGTLSTTDADAGDSHTYSLVSGTGSTDNASFNISGNQLRASAAFDYNNKSSYSIRVQTNDGTTTYQKQFTITVNDTPPALVSLSPADDATGVSPDAIFTATFDEPIQIASGVTQAVLLYRNGGINQILPADDEQLVISGNTLTINLTNDLWENTNYNIRIQSLSDLNENYNTSLGSTTWWNFTTGSATNNAPTNIALSATSIDENNTVNAVVGTLSTTDADAGDSHTYTLVSGTGSTDNASFNISGNQLRASAAFDFETKSSYSIRVQTNDGTATYQTQFTITVNDEDDAAPVIVSISPADGADDVVTDQVFTITLDEAPVVPTVATGLIRIKNGDGSNFTNIEFNQASIDNGYMTVSGNEITFSRGTLAYSSDYYILIDAGAIADENGNYITSYNSDADWWNFTTEEEPDTEAPTVVSTSPTDDATGVALDADLTLTFSENIQAGETFVRVKGKSTDSNVLGGRPQFDTDQFTVLNNTLTIHLENANGATPVQYSTEYYVTVSSGAVQDLNDNDFVGFTDNSTWTFTTEEAPNNLPTDIALSATSIDENNAINAVIGTLSTTDADAGDSHTYTLVSGTGSTDNASFNISGNQLRASAAFDFETKSSYSIRVQTNDGEDVFQKQFTITVNDVDDAAPVLVSITPSDNSAFDPEPRTLTMTFDEPIRRGNNNSATFRIYRANGSDFLNTALSDETRVSFDNNTVTVTFGGTWIPGSFYVTVSSNGIEDFNDNQYEGFSDPTFWNFTINDPSKTNQTITFTEITDKVFGDSDFDVTATASSGLDVSFSILSGPATISGSTVSITGAGTVQVAVNQAGDDTFNPASQAIQSFVVAKADQTIAITAIGDKLTTDESFMVSATVGSGLPLTYDVSGPATVSGSTITLTGEVGTVTLTVTQEGNDNYNAAEVTASFEVTESIVEKQDQLITIVAIADKLTTDAAFDIEASTSSELELTYIINGPASMDGSTITLDGSVGTVTVTVSQAGNETFNAASESVSFEVISDAALAVKAPVEIQTYPNPIVDKLYIKGLEGEKGILQLFSLGGRLVFSEVLNTNSVSVIGVESGIYILKLIANNSITTTKILIDK